MNETETNTQAMLSWKRRAAIGIPLLVGVAVLLVACGGGGGGSQAVTRKQPMATATISVPSTWKPRVPAQEVFNGNAVPPEPAPSVNNTTLAGVDSNGNGVRDDVERVLAGTSKKTTFELITFPMGRLYNTLATQQIVDSAAVVEINRQIFCLESRRSNSERDLLPTSYILNFTANTPGRRATFDSNMDMFAASGHSEEIPSCN